MKEACDLRKSGVKSGRDSRKKARRDTMETPRRGRLQGES